MTVDFRQLSIPSISRFLSFLRYKLDIGTNLLETSSAFFTNKGNCKSPFGAKFALFPLVWIFRKVPKAKRICHFAKNQTNEKIIEFSPRSDVFNYLNIKNKRESGGLVPLWRGLRGGALYKLKKKVRVFVR